MKRYDYLIVGSGLFGATFAYLAQLRGMKCLLVDKRSHLGGNVYCENVDGINVHKYGAHIFHTSDERVWNFVNSLTPFNRYTNSPIANFRGKLYNLPFNMNTFYQMWGVTTPEQAYVKIEEQKEVALRKMVKEGVSEPRNLEEQAQLLVGKDLYELLIKGYTEKQWGRKCCELPAFIIRRLPVRFVFDNNYFNDKYQGIPIGGYNKLIDALLEGCDTMTDTDFFDFERSFDSDRGEYVLQHSDGIFKAKVIVYSGKIDQFYDYRYGMLQYRTVSFITEKLQVPNYQGNAVVNYTSSDVPYTRIIEHKHFELFGQEVYDIPTTVISKEYSTEWTPGMEPFYPVNDERNQKLYRQYQALAAKEPNIIFGGRLAEYKYYDMAPIISKVMDMFNL